MAEESKKSDIRVESVGIVGNVVAQHSSMKRKKKKKNREVKDGFVGEDGELAARERESLVDDAVVKKKSKKKKVDSVVEDDGKKSKKKNKEIEVDSEADDDVGKSKKKRKGVDPDPEDGVKKSKKKSKELRDDSEAGDDGKKRKKKEKKSKKKYGGDEITSFEINQRDGELLVNTNDANRETGKRKRDDSVFGDDTEKSNEEVKRKSKMKKQNGDSEFEANIDSMENSKKGKKKKKKTKKKKKQTEDSEAEENNNDCTEDANKKQNVDSEAEANDSMENSKKEKKKKKKKKQTDDAEAEGNNNDRTEDANQKQNVDSEVEANIDSMENSKKEKKKKKKKKKKKQTEDSEAEGNNNDRTEDANQKQNLDSEVEVNNDSMENSKKEKKKRKKKQTETENAEAGENNNECAKKKRKKKQNCIKDVTSPSSKSTKKVKFSDQVEVFPSEDEGSEEAEKVEVVKGKRFTKEEDELIKKAVFEYIENHALGEEGLNMVLHCSQYPETKGCWKEIESGLPWRAPNSVYHRAHTIFEAGSKGQWSKEDFELLIEYQKKHGNDWRTLADAMGKHRKHVKDAWRRIRLNQNKGHWSREEYQNLFDLVNTDLRMKVYQEKHSKHGMLRDNIPWMAISDELGTRDHSVCCMKWYDQLTSPMVEQGIWANVDDYRLLDELTKLDAACVDDVDWDHLLDNRDGEACRKRWNQMVLHIGLPGTKTFVEQVEILSERYCPDIAEDREDFDNRPFDDKEDL